MVPNERCQTCGIAPDCDHRVFIWGLRGWPADGHLDAAVLIRDGGPRHRPKQWLKFITQLWFDLNSIDPGDHQCPPMIPVRTP